MPKKGVAQLLQNLYNGSKDGDLGIIKTLAKFQDLTCGAV